jgi:hypothetical protein
MAVRKIGNWCEMVVIPEGEECLLLEDVTKQSSEVGDSDL